VHAGYEAVSANWNKFDPGLFFANSHGQPTETGLYWSKKNKANGKS
jgi:hypothetical protein